MDSAVALRDRDFRARDYPDALEIGMPVTRISSVAVLGAGTMGAQIAAHFANAGVPALLLDLDARIAREGFERARKLKPDPLFGPDVASLVTFGGFDPDLARI